MTKQVWWQGAVCDEGVAFVTPSPVNTCLLLLRQTSGNHNSNIGNNTNTKGIKSHLWWRDVCSFVLILILILIHILTPIPTSCRRCPFPIVIRFCFM